ncbi:MAG: hypothetical protein M1817_002489 [Caeruleum heppii]|nr:MAG: hypothetical protein M1817_002489 [Caeruleum heppii]
MAIPNPVMSAGVRKYLIASGTRVQAASASSRCLQRGSESGMKRRCLYSRAETPAAIDHGSCRMKQNTTSTYTSRRHYAEQTRRKESLGPQNHYEMFPETLSSGPPPQGPFAVDVSRLRKEFLQLQSRAHPDRHAQEMKLRAEAASARINDAYKTLQDPLLRAQYLLSLRGIDVAEDETAKVEDPELLMEVLDVREQIEAAEAEDDLLPMEESNKLRIEESVRILDKAFTADDLVTAQAEAVKLRYWINIKDSLDAWEKGKPVVLVH